MDKEMKILHDLVRDQDARIRDLETKLAEKTELVKEMKEALEKGMWG